jgi:hypothetical protein
MSSQKPANSARNPVHSRRADQLVVALLQHPTLEKAAAAAGMNESTLWRWMQNEEFQDKYRRARRQAFSQAVARLQNACNGAVATLVRIMMDPAAPAHSRVRAADSVLVHSLRAMEVEDLEVRIACLETTAGRDSNTRDKRGRG